MSSSSSLPGTLGNIEIGLVLAIFLFGLETLQTFNYYRQFPQDALKLKILVYSMTVTFYGQPQHIEHPSFSFVLTLFFHSLLSAIVPVRFNLALLGELWRDEEVVLVETKLAWVVITASAVGPVVDIITAVSLCYALWRFKNPDFKRMSGVLQLVLYLARRDLLSNSLLASLNGRQRLRSRNDLQPNGSSHVIAFKAGVPTGNTGLVIHMERISEITHGEMGTSHKWFRTSSQQRRS
ncbi:hypothetical protein FB451DRAFT_1172322 [Mycena latifolia]|nr:hypothetical protein FB451DRAFT_1172322 [Mycena latifolia]